MITISERLYYIFHAVINAVVIPKTYYTQNCQYFFKEHMRKKNGTKDTRGKHCA